MSLLLTTALAESALFFVLLLTVCITTAALIFVLSFPKSLVQEQVRIFIRFSFDKFLVLSLEPV